MTWSFFFFRNAATVAVMGPVWVVKYLTAAKFTIIPVPWPQVHTKMPKA